jgi:hypothetical protein
MPNYKTRTKGRAVVTGMLLSICGLALGDEKQASRQRGEHPRAEKTAGVTAKLKGAPSGDSGAGQSWRLSINTDVVWRDFVLDQATEPAKAARTGTDKAAAKGRESVAREGHPQDGQMVVTVALDPQTEITMRYRSATDAIGEGSATPEGAGKSETASDNASGRKGAGAGAADSDRESRRQTLKARKLDPKELEPGLWVEVEYRQVGKQNQVARRVTVMRPVGGPDTSPDKEKPSKTSSANSPR